MDENLRWVVLGWVEAGRNVVEWEDGVRKGREKSDERREAPGI